MMGRYTRVRWADGPSRRPRARALTRRCCRVPTSWSARMGSRPRTRCTGYTCAGAVGVFWRALDFRPLHGPMRRNRLSARYGRRRGSPSCSSALGSGGGTTRTRHTAATVGHIATTTTTGRSATSGAQSSASHTRSRATASSARSGAAQPGQGRLPAVPRAARGGGTSRSGQVHGPRRRRRLPARGPPRP